MHAADLRALATERRDLTYFDHLTNAPWPQIDNPEHPVQPVADIHLLETARTKLGWRHWRDAFLDRFHALEHARITDAAQRRIQATNDYVTATDHMHDITERTAA